MSLMSLHIFIKPDIWRHLLYLNDMVFFGEVSYFVLSYISCGFNIKERPKNSGYPDKVVNKAV